MARTPGTKQEARGHDQGFHRHRHDERRAPGMRRERARRNARDFRERREGYRNHTPRLERVDGPSAERGGAPSAARIATEKTRRAAAFALAIARRRAELLEPETAVNAADSFSTSM